MIHRNAYGVRRCELQQVAHLFIGKSILWPRQGGFQQSLIPDPNRAPCRRDNVLVEGKD